MTVPDPNQAHGQQPGPIPPPGQAPQFSEPTAPMKKLRKKLAIILAAVSVLVLLCCGGVVIAVVGGNDKPAGIGPTPAAPAKTNTAIKATPKKEPAAPPTPAAPGLNDPVRDGKFEFTVTRIDCGKTRIGDEYLNEEAQGIFCLVGVTVKNIGKEAQTFSGTSQKAFDSSGTEYSNDTGAEIYANQNAQTFLNEINPGNQVRGQLVFDVPKGTRLTRLELHDSMFSGGVHVKLS